jgi:hypothetical protein
MYHVSQKVLHNDYNDSYVILMLYVHFNTLNKYANNNTSLSLVNFHMKLKALQQTLFYH